MGSQSHDRSDLGFTSTSPIRQPRGWLIDKVRPALKEVVNGTEKWICAVVAHTSLSPGSGGFPVTARWPTDVSHRARHERATAGASISGCCCVESVSVFAPRRIPLVHKRPQLVVRESSRNAMVGRVERVGTPGVVQGSSGQGAHQFNLVVSHVVDDKPSHGSTTGVKHSPHHPRHVRMPDEVPCPMCASAR